MRQQYQYKAPGRRGGILISVLAYVVVISLILAGITSLAISHYIRVRTESDYANAINAAEAGVNYELNKISINASTADQYNAASANGTSVATPAGNFQVYVKQWNADNSETAPFSAPNNVVIYSTGTVNGLSRTVRSPAKGYFPNGDWAIFTIDRVSFWNGSAISITGDVQSDNVLDFSGHPGIVGNVIFNGPNAGWFGGSDPGGYTVVRRPHAVLFPTVDQIANQKWPIASFPPGGMLYLATHNSNANAIPPIVGNSITTDVTLVGPGDYYLTNINLSGQRSITLDNTNGPIRVWVGPSGGNSTCRFRGGSSAIKPSADPTKTCYLYCATTTGINIAGNSEIDMSMYCYNKDVVGSEYGYIVNSGNPTFYGQMLANEIDLNGNITVMAVPNQITPSNVDYYGCVNNWQEINGAN